MEAEFKSTQRFVTLLVGILLKIARSGHSAYKCRFPPFQGVFSIVYMDVCLLSLTAFMITTWAN